MHKESAVVWREELVLHKQKREGKNLDLHVGKERVF